MVQIESVLTDNELLELQSLLDTSCLDSCLPDESDLARIFDFDRPILGGNFFFPDERYYCLSTLLNMLSFHET